MLRCLSSTCKSAQDGTCSRICVHQGWAHTQENPYAAMMGAGLLRVYGVAMQDSASVLGTLSGGAGRCEWGRVQAASVATGVCRRLSRLSPPPGVPLHAAWTRASHELAQPPAGAPGLPSGGAGTDHPYSNVAHEFDGPALAAEQGGLHFCIIPDDLRPLPPQGEVVARDDLHGRAHGHCPGVLFNDLLLLEVYS